MLVQYQTPTEPNGVPVHTPRDANGKPLYADVDYMETWRALERLHRERRVRHIGLSNFNRSQIERVLALADVKPHVLQVRQMALRWTAMTWQSFEFCLKNVFYVQ